MKNLFYIFLFTFLLLGIVDIIISKIKPQFEITHYIYDHGFNTNKEKFQSWGKEQVKVFSNNLGFKGPENQKIDLKKGDKKRIVFIGDSFTEGIGMKYEESFVGVFDNLNKNKYEVINMGVASYAPSAYFKKLEYWINSGLEIDEVIVLPDLSDIEDEIFHYRDNLNILTKRESLSSLPFAVNEITPLINKQKITKELIEEYKEIRGSEWLEQFDLKSNEVKLFQWLKSKLTYSFIYRKINYLIHFNALKKAHEAANKNILYKPENNVRGLYLVDKNTFYRRSAKTGLLKMAVKLNQLKVLLDKNNIKMKLGIYPWPSEFIYSNDYSIWRNFWTEFSKFHELQIFDTYTIFNEKINNNHQLKQYFIPGDFHFNPDGNKLIGEFIFKNY